MKKLFFALVSFLLVVGVSASTVFAQEPRFSDEYVLGEVVEILEERSSEVIGDQQTLQRVRIRVEEGKEAGKLLETDHAFQRFEAEDQQLQVGEQVVVLRNQEFEKVFYYVADKYRLPLLAGLLAGFFLLVFVFTGFKGFTALLGLAFNIFVIVSFVLPRIIAGDDPLLISFVAGLVIAVVSLYFAHGFNQRTSIALAGTLLSLLVALFLSVVFVALAQLSGIGTEEAFFLQFGEYANVNLKGLLLGGIIIGALGVLDDVTTAQSAAVHELKRANPKYGFRQLYQSGLSIGKEHITSLVNTLALAYAGASLPVLLLFTISSQPLWVILNSESIAEEFIRTLVGSAALILAVPITTALAAWWWSNRTPSEKLSCGHVH